MKKDAVVVDVAAEPESTTRVEHHHDHEARPRFDPQAALDELERFGRDIQRYRQQREALGDEFESFVRSFTNAPQEASMKNSPEADPPSSAPPSSLPPSSAPPASSVQPPSPPASAAPVEPLPPMDAASLVDAAPPALAVAPPAPTLTEPRTGEAAVVTEGGVVPVRRAPAKTPTAAIAAGAALLVGGVLLAAFLLNRGSEPVPPTAATPEPAASAPSAAATATPIAPADATPAAAPAPVAANNYEIVTDRMVWMRVTVDGARVLEREVPAGSRIPLKAEKSIVIRTGDAGAVRVSLQGGTATPLGREGEVVTRSFTVPSRAPDAR